jgi:UDP-glucose 4-epimerase
MIANKILVTGGAGYIGSHTCLALLESGYDVVVLDNLCNSTPESLRRVENLAGKGLTFIEGDVRDVAALENLFKTDRVSAVFHFAGLKAVGESVKQPLSYFSVNVAGTIALCKAMENFGIFTLIFSSSATVYGDPVGLPITEGHAVGKTLSPYAKSKFMAEEIMRELAQNNPSWKIAVLRFFNPVGAHESGQIGEDPKDIPNNLLPYICQVAVGKRWRLGIFGADYATCDGTGVRDYIHVMDVAEGHLAALEAFDSYKFSGLQTWNLGTGVGYSVLEVINAFEKVSGQTIPYEILARRTGDIAEIYADPTKAQFELGWTAKYNLKKMMSDAWHWQRKNPQGYASNEREIKTV